MIVLSVGEGKRSEANALEAVRLRWSLATREHPGPLLGQRTIVEGKVRTQKGEAGGSKDLLSGISGQGDFCRGISVLH